MVGIYIQHTSSLLEHQFTSFQTLVNLVSLEVNSYEKYDVERILACVVSLEQQSMHQTSIAQTFHFLLTSPTV